MKFLVAFDLDGTLVDTSTAIVESFTAAFMAMGVEPPAAADLRATIGLPLEGVFAGLLGVPAGDVAVATGVERYRAAFTEIVLPQAERLLFPGVPDGLTALSAEGFTLAVATSKFTASAEALLRAAGVRHEFTMVVGADQVTHPKPHPEAGQLIMRELGVPPHHALMVGDTTHDLLMARAAGMRSIGVTYGIHDVRELRSANPTWLAGSFAEVLDCIRAGGTEALRTAMVG